MTRPNVSRRHKLPQNPKFVPAFTHHEDGEVLGVEPGEKWGEHALRLERVGVRIIEAAREVRFSSLFSTVVFNAEFRVNGCVSCFVANASGCLDSLVLASV
jgi:hypothetical protein